MCCKELDEVSGNFNNVVDEDLDYSAEEAAKEELLRNEQHDSSFSGRRKYLLTSVVMLENAPIWREFWNEWKEKKLTLRQSITDVKPLCKLPKNYKILVDCNSTSSSIFACVDAEKGTITKCNNSRNAIYSVPLCMEVSKYLYISAIIFYHDHARTFFFCLFARVMHSNNAVTNRGYCQTHIFSIYVL